MGNNQSSAQNECPSPFCKALCFGKPPNSDEGEWFGDLPKDKKRRKSRRRREPKRLPSVPEEGTTCSDTVDTEESSSILPPPSISRTTSKSIDERPNLERRNTESQILKPTSSRSVKLPKTKLTFVNGQFVDVSTEEGRNFAKMFDAREEDVDVDGSSPDVSVRGVETHVSGHCGIIRESTDTSRSPSRSLATFKKTASTLASSTLTSLPSFSSQDSDLSKGSLKESVSKGSLIASVSKGNSKEAVSSIVMLGDGYFLTAAVADRNIKMWKIANGESDESSSSITFVRDFSGCPTGITCLTKVDRKGRFLSGSKCGTVMLWDSRFNCNDSEEGEEECQLARKHQVLLATFESLMRRRVDTIAMIDDGTYVRPTDSVDWSMMAAVTKKAAKEGSNSVQRAARERQIIACSLQFASITGAHRTVKVWSVKHNDKKKEEKEEMSEGENVAEIKLVQELEHDNVVESVATMPGKSMLLAGDRMGSVTLWKGIKNVFKRGSPKMWHCIRVFNWRQPLELHKCKESMQFSITSLTFLGEKYFVSGARGGDLRIWNVNGSGAKDETVHNELIGLSGAHSSEITSIITGRDVVEGSSKEKMMTFNTCGKDGMVLSFMVPAERPIPRCFNVVNLGIADRYTSDGDSISALSLGCHEKEPITALIVGSSCGGIKVLQQPYPSLGPQDALLAYRQQIKEESLTLQVIAENVRSAIKCTNRKKNMQSYADCFTGGELVSYLVDEKHAARRVDAVMLGCALQTHLSLFHHVSKECQLLQDDIRSFYRFGEQFKKRKSHARLTL